MKYVDHRLIIGKVSEHHPSLWVDYALALRNQIEPCALMN